MLFWSSGKELKRIPKGKKEKFKCSKCDEETTWYEAQVDDSFKAFMVVELWKSSKRVMQCCECLYVADYYTLYPDEKAAYEEELRKNEEAMKQHQAEADAKQREQDAKRREAEEKELARQEEIARKKRDEERAMKDKALDAEVEALKKKLGK